MPHMHLPIQSGSDTVLRRMARRCKTVEFARLVEQARDAIPLFNVTTDLIAGFPGETDQEWRQTMEFIASVGFGHMHIFPFSARAGTKAARLPEQIDGAVRKARSREMHALAAELKQRELSRHIGTEVAVLWEQQINVDTGQWIGYTPHYHKIISADSSIYAASISRVSVDSLSDDSTMLANSARQAQVQLAEIGHQGA
jgi:threonylcarbamoyladenosine tRNA methylthiotransferase MtaB